MEGLGEIGVLRATSSGSAPGSTPGVAAPGDARGVAPGAGNCAGIGREVPRAIDQEGRDDAVTGLVITHGRPSLSASATLSPDAIAATLETRAHGAPVVRALGNRLVRCHATAALGGIETGLLRGPCVTLVTVIGLLLG